jgi:hypothetical protein
MSRSHLLYASLGGRHRFYQLRTAYQEARPRRSRWGPSILTADEVFRQKARDDGFSDEQIAMFVEHIDL